MKLRRTSSLSEVPHLPQEMLPAARCTVNLNLFNHSTYPRNRPERQWKITEFAAACAEVGNPPAADSMRASGIECRVSWARGAEQNRLRVMRTGATHRAARSHGLPIRHLRRDRRRTLPAPGLRAGYYSRRAVRVGPQSPAARRSIARTTRHRFLCTGPQTTAHVPLAQRPGQERWPACSQNRETKDIPLPCYPRRRSGVTPYSHRTNTVASPSPRYYDKMSLWRQHGPKIAPVPFTNQASSMFGISGFGSRDLPHCGQAVRPVMQ